MNIDAAEPKPGEQLRVIGFGNTAYEGEVSQTLQEVDVNVVDDVICKRLYKAANIAIDSEIMVCTGVYGGGKGSCQGDSGGPLFATTDTGAFLLVAVVSWGKVCTMIFGFVSNPD